MITTVLNVKLFESNTINFLSFEKALNQVTDLTRYGTLCFVLLIIFTIGKQ